MLLLLLLFLFFAARFVAVLTTTLAIIKILIFFSSCLSPKDGQVCGNVFFLFFNNCSLHVAYHWTMSLRSWTDTGDGEIAVVSFVSHGISPCQPP
ncbi:hypothetical protein T492DRAFT_1053279 [Pavlovales sp. CCMP2436]|nr:hypothetical protein T492DRAFT_1053279 [Pavlovales sp. CCMP2436]